MLDALRRLLVGAPKRRGTVTRGTLVYVHGASDRAVEVADHVARIELQLRQAGMPLDVVASRWGEAVGPTLARLELAIPSAAESQVSHLATLGERDLALAVDPLAELRALAEAPQARSPARPAGVAPAAHSVTSREADQLLAICRAAIGTDADVVTTPDGGVTPLPEACRRAATAIQGSREYASAHATAPEVELVAATGRAVAATAAGGLQASVGLVERIQLRMAEAVLGIAAGTLLAGYLGIDVGPALKRWATDVLLPHRAELTRDLVRGPADVLVYQRNGGPIRRFVARSIGHAITRGRPVVALGNSLGGIVLVDALSQPGAPSPDLLVTVGSQSPALATFGALHPLDSVGSGTPFQPWLNIYDHRDLLAFVAQPIWPEARGIVDAAVDSGLGFPDSHGATYLSNPEVYRLVREHLDAGRSKLA